MFSKGSKEIRPREGKIKGLILDCKCMNNLHAVIWTQMQKIKRMEK